MKIRNDFVSNSSSCSFTVSDANKLMELLEPLGDMPGAYQYFEISAWCYQKDYADIYKVIWESEPPREYFEYKDDEPKLLTFDDYNHFLYTWKELPKDLKSKIFKIEIGCEDYHTSEVALLNLLYQLCELADLNPNDDYTEIPFRDGEKVQPQFIVNLHNKITELKDRKKCQKP